MFWLWGTKKGVTLGPLLPPGSVALGRWMTLNTKSEGLKIWAISSGVLTLRSLSLYHVLCKCVGNSQRSGRRDRARPKWGQGTGLQIAMCPFRTGD